METIFMNVEKFYELNKIYDDLNCSEKLDTFKVVSKYV